MLENINPNTIPLPLTVQQPENTPNPKKTTLTNLILTVSIR
ncbi:MAG: hypothetical protein ACP5OK_09620 [Thermoprotei archaeon]